MPTNLHLHDDITLEILSWLPAKDTFRFRCVSRRWRALLSDARFASKHARRNARPPVASFFLRDNFYHTEHFALAAGAAIPDPRLSFVPGRAGRDRVSVSATCNGLVICCRATAAFYDFRYYVCNPTTKESVALPVPDRVGPYLSLAFDPSKSDGYKVVGVGRDMHVYSSRSRDWRLSVDEESLSEFGGFHVLRGGYWDGRLLWVGKECIMSFDAEEESLTRLPTPSGPYECAKITYIGESGGRLQMIRSCSSRTNLEILELGSRSSRWSVLHNVDLCSVKDFCPRDRTGPICASRFGPFSPVYFVRAEGVLLLSVPGKIVSYNVVDDTFGEVVCDVLTPPSGSYYCPYDWYKFFPLGNTLFSP